MPSYLRDYITEFNYLFHQIYKCRNQGGTNEPHEPFYGFGNNLRKFLEAFLFLSSLTMTTGTMPLNGSRNSLVKMIRLQSLL